MANFTTCVPADVLEVGDCDARCIGVDGVQIVTVNNKKASARPSACILQSCLPLSRLPHWRVVRRCAGRAHHPHPSPG